MNSFRNAVVMFQQINYTSQFSPLEVCDRCWSVEPVRTSGRFLGSFSVSMLMVMWHQPYMQPLTWFVQIATCLKHVTKCKCQHTHDSTVENNERCLMNAYANYRFLIHLHKAEKQPRREREGESGWKLTRQAQDFAGIHQNLYIAFGCSLGDAHNSILQHWPFCREEPTQVDDNDDDVWRKTANHRIGKSLFNYVMILSSCKTFSLFIPSKLHYLIFELKRIAFHFC